MKKLMTVYGLEILGAITGGIFGLGYWYFVGCSSGSCAITSNPLISTLYGAILGALVFGMFKTQKQTTDKNETNSR